MKVLVKKVNQYSLDEFNDYCFRNAISNDSGYYRVWAIERQTEDIYNLINLYRNKLADITGSITISNNQIKNIKPTSLRFDIAIKRIMTPDLNDIEITLDDNKILCNCYHYPNLKNIFKLTIHD